MTKVGSGNQVSDAEHEARNNRRGGARMFDSIKRYFARRRLRPVVAVLPFVLAQRFGNTEFYTVGQAKKTIADLKIKPALMDYALVVALANEDAMLLSPFLNAGRCDALRCDIAVAFYLPEDDFTAKDLRQAFTNRRKVRAGETSIVEISPSDFGGDSH